MMRLRRASAIVVLLLLASAATAYAECAWVLWKQVVDIGVAATSPGQRDMSKLLAWEPQGAHEKKTGCEDALASEQRRMREAGGNPKLVCLPDTVDPSRTGELVRVRATSLHSRHGQQYVIFREVCAVSLSPSLSF